MRPVLVDIQAAAEVIAGAADRTPLVPTPHGRAVCRHEFRLTLRGALTAVAGLRDAAPGNRA